MANTSTYGPDYYRRGNIQVWDFIRDQGLTSTLVTQLNTFAEQATKKIESQIFAKQSTIYKMNSKMQSFLSSQAKEFRRGFQVTNSTTPASRSMQRSLIVKSSKSSWMQKINWLWAWQSTLLTASKNLLTLCMSAINMQRILVGSRWSLKSCTCK